MTRIIPSMGLRYLGHWWGLVAVALWFPCAAHGQLRIVDYNTAGGINGNLQTVLRAIGEEEINGIAKPIDVLLLQEQDSPFSDTQTFVDYLNGVYGAGTYARGNLIGGPTTSTLHQTIVYNTNTVDLIAEKKFGNTLGATAQERQTMRYQLRPIDPVLGASVYDGSADFYAYNSHYKASFDPDENAEAIQRNSEATNIRADYNTLGDGTHAIYAGDHNIYYSTEPAFQTLTAAGPGQAIDPVNRIGYWHINSDFADVHTQSPCTSGCGVTGGMDDRFDFQLLTDEFMDDEGLSYIDGSYRAFGNNGVSYDTDINNAANLSDVTGYPFNGVTTYTRTQVLNALRNGTDHLPIVVDYQVPAILSVLADSVPATINQGDPFDLGVTVWNSASVVAAIGADELDYSLTTSGDLTGEFLSQMDLALGAMNMHAVGFDTSTPGMKSGTITVSSDSQAVGSGSGVVGGVWTLNVMYEVLAAAGLAGDYNENDVIDAADYTAWRDAVTAGSSTLANDPTPGTVDESDFIYWRDHFGDVLGSGAGSGAAAVPEPSAWLMLLLGVCLTRLMGGKLGAWTRRS